MGHGDRVFLELIWRRLGQLLGGIQQRMNSESTCWYLTASESGVAHTKSGHGGSTPWIASFLWKERQGPISLTHGEGQGLSQDGLGPWLPAAFAQGQEGKHMVVGVCHRPVVQVMPWGRARHLQPGWSY